MRYLAIDLGQKRTGLAVGDDETGIASPVGVVEAGGDEQRLTMIRHAIAEHGPDALVLGLPLNMDDSEGPGVQAARAFARLLETRLGLAVHLFDERLTTAAADEQMRGIGLTRKGKKQRRDALAAAVMLQSFLATKNRKTLL